MSIRRIDEALVDVKTAFPVNVLLRVFALYGRDRRIVSLLIGVSIACVAICIVSVMFMWRRKTS